MMSNDKLNSIIREVSRIAGKEPEKRTGRCPSDEDLADYVASAVRGEKIEEGLHRHITECDCCFAKTASAISALTALDKKMDYQGSARVVQKAKSLPRIYPKAKSSYMKRNRYLFVAAAFFLLSFLYRAYFLQFLTAALIFGFKWVMDTGGSRALIMIYDAWQHRKDKDSSRFFKESDRSHF